MHIFVSIHTILLPLSCQLALLFYSTLTPIIFSIALFSAIAFSQSVHSSCKRSERGWFVVFEYVHNNRSFILIGGTDKAISDGVWDHIDIKNKTK